MSRFKPLYQRLGISRTATVHCPWCKLPFYAHALGAHICRKAPHPTMDRRVVSFSEWKAAVARGKAEESCPGSEQSAGLSALRSDSKDAKVAKIGRAGL